MSATKPHSSSKLPLDPGRVEGTALAPVPFHSVVPRAALISTDDLGAATYISPPP